MEKQWHLITGVEPGSIAEECGLEPGDRIGAVNGHEIEDFFDYQYYIEEEFLRVEVLTKDGEECTLEIEKEEDEDLGLVFESFLMDDYNSCCNKCMFCFIDQMPPGMRETLYFKDDDSRLSFLQGNYITLTNMKEKDIDRVIRYHLAPINISVHTTNPELRCRMLHNRFAGDVMEKIRRFSDAGIPMNSQVVLCKGINDGEELDRTIRELGDFLPCMESLSVVPVGLTKYRDDLPKLEAFTKEDAKKVLSQIQGWQKHFLETRGTSFVHASDEWFILAGEEFPPVDYYEGFGQLENGVGMMRLLISEVEERLSELTGDDREKSVSIATAKLAFPTIRKLAEQVTAKYPRMHIHVYCIENTFFGEQITVSGLLTGQDIERQLKGRELGDELLLPCNVLKADEDIFLDDMSLSALSESLQVPVNIIQSEGQDFVNKIISK
ncbi:MAG TPA: DUF512 domain-containing protein [Candidatus Anaerobutyricum faecale]|uniref:DUF512 domain-containing protein n=1 Tax=Eubacterium sp. An11 TaxID=1965542 RepID=UPI000B3766EC|nr:DUF512 domain-containing protein [Eubacterium sp. An11]OUQ70315.1 Fe/S oxidoreductase [Eubacterium sp. An11]HJC32583.1 DUF512 domain-containing protein [Candidatus Anaerobutyricum faecale]